MSHLSHCHGGLTAEDEWSGDDAPHESLWWGSWGENSLMLWWFCSHSSFNVSPTLITMNIKRQVGSPLAFTQASSVPLHPLESSAPQENICPFLPHFLLLPEQNPKAADTDSPSVIEKINRWRRKKSMACMFILCCWMLKTRFSSCFGVKGWMRWDNYWGRAEGRGDS